MSSLNYPSSMEIIEVGPRDGLQNEEAVLETNDKVKFIQLLRESGLKTIEATSFVRPDRIPQMGDASELMKKLVKTKEFEDGHYPCLVPNMKGLESAIDHGVKDIAVFTATSDTFNQKNINATVKESLERLGPVVAKARAENLRVRGYVSTAFGCPYEGESSIEKLVTITQELLSWGCYEVSVGDTIGVAHPLLIEKTLAVMARNQIPSSRIALHFHDTRGMALVNIHKALILGYYKFDSSAGGLGGCPYAVGATGNVATEDLVYLAEKLGINCGVDMDKLVKASSFILKKLNKVSPSKFHQAYQAKKK